MSREGKLAKSTAIYFIGSFGSKLLSFVLLPLYAQYLTTESYGNYDLINTIIQIAYPAITLMLDNALYVYLIGTDDQKRKDDMIAFAIKTLFCNGCLAVILCYIINRIMPITYVGWIIYWLLSFSTYNTWIQACRGMNQQKLYAITGVLVTAVTLAGNMVGLIVLKQDYRFLMISNCIAYTVSIIFLESRIHVFTYAMRGHASGKLKKEVLRYTVPLLPNQLSWWILNVSDRLMMVYFLGSGANGIYAMACKIPAILNVVHGIFSAAWSDDILSSADIRETEGYAGKIYNLYIRLLVGISIILMASNRFIFEYMIAGNFVEAYRYTYFLYIGFIFSSIGALLGAFYGYFKMSLNVSVSTIAAAFVNFLINLIFLEKYGIEVASISTCLGSIAIWLIRLRGLTGLVKIEITMQTKLVFLFLIPFYFVANIEGLPGNICLILIGIGCAVLINLRTIREIYHLVIKRVRS